MKTIDSIYGDYATLNFIQRLQEIGEDAEKIAKLNRDEQTYKDIHSQSTSDSAEAVRFWVEIQRQCKEWLKCR